MKANTEEMSSNILMEQFIPDNVFIYVAKGVLQTYDGTKKVVFKTGDCFIAQKNRLAKYELLEGNFEPVIFCFDEPYLQQFQKKHPVQTDNQSIKDAFIRIPKKPLLSSFIQSIKPYYKGRMEFEKDFEDLKYEELLLILLRIKPELTEVLFDFRKLGKIDLETFMNKNYVFNVSNQRFATLTGRSLSAFKRDFQEIFEETPNRWLVKKRLEEAYFLMKERHQKPNDFYLDLGFESLSHFSTAFKKQFGDAPSALVKG